MKRKQLVFIPVMLLLFCSFTNDGKWKKISNTLYFFSIPSNWEAAVTDKTDGYVPGERDATYPGGIRYHLYYLQWHTPYKGNGDFSDVINVSVESYKRTDAISVSLKEIEKAKLALTGGEDITILKEENISTSQKKIMLTKTGKELNGSKVKYRYIHLICKSGDIVHCVQISSPESHYLLPETQKMIKDILDSFSVKNK
jgi:hypothetical protein